MVRECGKNVEDSIGIMNILHISGYYSPFIGGIETVCKYLVDNMPQHQTSVMCFNKGRKDSVDVVDGHKVYRAGIFLTVAHQGLSLSYGRMLARAIREEKPDIIHYHWANPFPALFLRFRMPDKVRLVLHWHMDIIRQRYLYRVVKPLETWLLKRAERIVVTSPQYMEFSPALQKFRDKVRVVPNCIDEAALQMRDGDEDAIREIRNRWNGRPVVLFVGRHTQYKGIDHLIRAEKYMKEDCVILIAGEGTITEQLKSLSEQCRTSKIHFIGKLSPEDLRRYLHVADVFAFPSVSRNEAFGIALAEAMYCHTPAVTFTIEGSGVNWVNLNGVTGIEVPQDEMQDCNYAKALDVLLQDKELRGRYADAAHKRVSENFLLKNMLSAMENAYEE